jgi:hypothetical protein
MIPNHWRACAGSRRGPSISDAVSIGWDAVEGEGSTRSHVVGASSDFILGQSSLGFG